MKQLYYKNGELYARLSEEKREYFYENGTAKTLENYCGGKLHGEVVLYYPNGGIKRRCSFEEGVRHGFDEMWDEEGLLVDEGSYEMGRPIGMHRRYRKTGLIEEIEYLQQGRFNLREWDEEGTLRVEAVWQDLDYKERIWDRFEAVWVKKQGYWDGRRLVYL